MKGDAGWKRLGDDALTFGNKLWGQPKRRRSVKRLGIPVNTERVAVMQERAGDGGDGRKAR